MTSTLTDPKPSWTRYWLRYLKADGTWQDRHKLGPPGAELAALRRGIGREPWEIPAMWPFYSIPDDDGRATPEVVAEHAALTLYAVHQQSVQSPMHRAGVSLGRAVRKLPRPHTAHGEGGAAAASIDWSRVDAVDRRFAAAATATDVSELVQHLRGLIALLRRHHTPLDYDWLWRDLRDWHYPDRAARVRRRWGMDYFTRTRPAPVTADDANEADEINESEEDS